MLNYVRGIPTKVYFGKGQITNLECSLNLFGKRVLLAYGGGSIKRLGLYDEVMDILNKGGFEVTELSGIEPNPRIESVIEGVRLCFEKKIDVILAVGGGSVIDCVKAIAVIAKLPEGTDAWSHIQGRKAPTDVNIPIVDILTLSATGSEYDMRAVITNLKTNEKLARSYCFPAVSICDPTYTYTVPAYHTAAGSADIMSHIFEGYFSVTNDCDLSEGIAETILKSVMSNCLIALKEPENYSARANLMVNSTIAMSGIPAYGKQATGWPCHAMEHELSAFYDITHGTGLAILTPNWMRFILKKDPSTLPRFVKFAKNVMGITKGSDMEMALAGIDALEGFFHSIGLEKTLTELGIDESHIEEMAAHANEDNRLRTAYVPLSHEDTVAIYRACL